MPLTPPPRRAPAPQSSTSCGRLDAPGARPRSALGPGPLQRPVEDVAAGQPEVLLEVDRGPHLDAGVAVGVAPRTSSIGSASTESSERSVAARRLRAPRLVVLRGRAGPAGAARRGSASARRWPAGRGRGSSGRSACGSRSRTAAGRGCARRPARHTPAQLAVALVDVEGAGEGGRGSTRSSRSRGSRVSSMLTLSWAPSAPARSRPGPAPAAASSWLSTVGAQAGVDVAARARAHGRRCRQVTSPSGSTETNSAPVTDRRAGRDRRLRKRVGDRAHAADRHVPVAGAAADEVVEEADVLAQGRLVEVGERADQGVGGDDAAHGVVGERHRSSSSPSGRAVRASPELVVTDEGAHVGARTAAARARSGRPAGRAVAMRP